MLETNDLVGVIAPSARGASLFPDRFRRGVSALEKGLGVRVTTRGVVERSSGYLAESTEVRSNALLDLLTDPAVKAVFTTYGGHNSSDLLPALRARRDSIGGTMLVGYSDTTALLLAYHSLTGETVYYGPAILPELGEVPEPLSYTMQALKHTLCVGGLQQIEDPKTWAVDDIDWAVEGSSRARSLTTNPGRQVWRSGHGQGVLYGGNLPTLNHLLGTPYAVPPQEPYILFVEVTPSSAKLPVLRSYLSQLKNAGILAGLSGLLLGRIDLPTAEDLAAIRQLVIEFCAGTGFPIVANLPFGHNSPMTTIPIGAQSDIEASEDRARWVIL